MQKTPKVLVQFNIGEAPAQPREVIKRVTKNKEEVEVNGFTFKRQRASAPEAPPENRHPGHAAAAAALSQQQQQPRPSPSVGTVAGPRLCGPGISAADPAAAASALAELCERAVAAEAAATPGNDALAAALAQVGHIFGSLVEQAVLEGRVQAALVPARTPNSGRGGAAGALTPRRRTSSQSEVGSEPDRAVDLAARKAGLRARLAAFEKEEAEWQALLEKADALQLGGSDGHEAGAAAAAPVGDVAAADEAAAAAEAPAAPAAAEEHSVPPAAAAALAAVKAEAHRRLAMQVEGMCLLVGDVEELVERASASAAAVQAGYHAQKFGAFSHVDSPAQLIKLIAGGGRGAGGGAGSSGGREGN